MSRKKFGYEEIDREISGRIPLSQNIRRQRGAMAVSLDQIPCDYYHWMQGDIEAINAYRGEYMSPYSWGEFTLGGIEMTMSTAAIK